MSLKQWIAFSIPMVFVAFVVYAGQAGISDGREASLIKRISGGWTTDSPLSYEGEAVLFERPDAMVVFSRGATVLPLTIAFDLHLHWDEEMRAAAMDGDVELRDISGWMSILYDPETSSLSVTVVDDAGDEQDLSYTVGPHSDTDKAHASFDAHLRLFFHYMNGGSLLGDGGDEGGVALACAGGFCSCSHPPGCTICRVCCPPGFFPICNCTPPNCRCTCTKYQEQ